jgi:hypothetical protein
MLSEKLMAVIRRHTQLADQRRSGRPRMSRAATIQVPELGDDKPCLLVDVSAHGARLQTSSSVGLVREIYLTVPSLDLIVTCQVIWVSEGEIGVRFVEEDSRAIVSRLH